MEAKECRILNKIEYLKERNPDLWEPIEVNPYTFSQMIVEPERFRGIPLTSEWLNKFGFEQFQNWGYRTDKYIVEHMTSSGIFVFRIRQTSDESYALKYLSDVHELQNIYHAINNTELLSNEQLN